MKELIFVTGNPLKFELAESIFARSGIKIIQLKANIPENQAETTEEVAKFSSKYAADMLNKPVLVNDSGFFINALKGFPGIYTKDINQKFTTQNILDLMASYSDRTVRISDVTAYCEPGSEPVIFSCDLKAYLLTESKTNYPNCFDNLLMIEDFLKVRGDYGVEELKSLTSSFLTSYHDMAKFVINK